MPLLKEMFASERRKAKVLNFSIAYGKTAHGLSKDWKVSLDEAKATVQRWYADRSEVGLPPCFKLTCIALHPSSRSSVMLSTDLHVSVQPYRALHT